MCPTYIDKKEEFFKGYYTLESDSSFCLLDMLRDLTDRNNLNLAVYEDRVAVLVSKTVDIKDLEEMLVFITLKTSITFKMVDKYN